MANATQRNEPPTTAPRPEAEPDRADNPIAEGLRVILARRRLVHSQVAARAGMTPTQLSNRLAGRTEITAAELLRLAEAIGVPATQLLNYKSELATR